MPRITNNNKPSANLSKRKQKKTMSSRIKDISKTRNDSKRRALDAFSIRSSASDHSDDDIAPSSEFTKGLKDGDDEEIDSDEAFDSDDADKYDSFSFSGSTKKNSQKSPRTAGTKKIKRRLEIDLNEDSDLNSIVDVVDELPSSDDSQVESASDFEDDKGDDLMDLSEMLGSSVKQIDAAAVSTKNAFANFEEIPYTETIISSDDSAISAMGDSDESFSSDDSFLRDDESEDAADFDALVEHLDADRSRGESAQVGASDVVSRQNVPKGLNEMKPENEYNVSLSNPSDKLRLEDLIGTVNTGTYKSLKKTMTLSAPLAKPLQDRIDRSAAYDTVKTEITKWQPAVRNLRQAQVLKFPLHEAAPVQLNNNALASNFTPSNPLEAKIESILKESGMRSEQELSALEDFEMAKLTVEEVRKRRAELAQMRDLIFRQERKAKRQSKIKSKAYRRVHRMEREKLQAAMDESFGDPEESNARDLENRARERMELRHKNTGKWAKKMLARADHGEGSRAAITEQLQRGEQLERKILGRDEDDAANESDSDLAEADSELPRRGVFGMKFMRDADAQEAELDRESEDGDDHSTDSPPAETGRRKFAPAQTAKRAEKPGTSLQAHGAVDATMHVASVRKPTSVQDSPAAEQDNPWLALGRPTKSKTIAVERDSDHATKFASKLAKGKKQQRHLGNINTTQLDTSVLLPLKENVDAEDSIPLFSQADLVAQAFAGDDVVAEFQTVKESVKMEDGPKEIDETLPGWGSWTGEGVKKDSRKRVIRHVEGVDPTKRRDAKLAHVIINEKRMKLAKPFMSTSVPYPFENKEQYERSLRMPVGPEWASRSTFQKTITPKLIVRQGTVVAPMDSRQ